MRRGSHFSRVMNTERVQEKGGILMKTRAYESPRLIDLRAHEKTMGYGHHCVTGSAPAAVNCGVGNYAVACHAGGDVGEN